MLLDGSWVHIDPCEAAVNEPLIYESWGKKPTYVLAYSVNSTDSPHSADIDSADSPDYVCDVTDCYVSDASNVASRRLAEDISEVAFERLLKEANNKLRAIMKL